MSNIKPKSWILFLCISLNLLDGKFHSSCPFYCSHYGCSSWGSRANLPLMLLVSSPVSLTPNPMEHLHMQAHTFTVPRILPLECQAF